MAKRLGELDQEFRKHHDQLLDLIDETDELMVWRVHRMNWTPMMKELCVPEEHMMTST